ncbi:MAG: ABC transporter ATP-binding protein [Atopobiaceae bacterium]|jgi:putative ABC transport system ATP-binding protein|nr:ABC transporter ATP-binding protein [Atopobiaceae bacterium]
MDKKKAAVAVAGSQTALLELSHVGKVYGGRGVVTTALDDVSLAVRKGEFVAIMGPSGSGKSTLLNCVATIDAVTSGSITLGGRDVTRLRRGELARFRRDELGFIFQDSNLLDTLTGFENIALALTLKGEHPHAIDRSVTELARTLGIEDVLQKFPQQMSGGQRQRVAAARAIVGKPQLVLADEPTGALDSKSSAVLLDVLDDMNARMGATILMVTHDAFAASYSTRTVFVRDGRLFNEVARGDVPRTEYYQRIMEVMAFLGGDLHAR